MDDTGMAVAITLPLLVAVQRLFVQRMLEHARQVR